VSSFLTAHHHTAFSAIRYCRPLSGTLTRNWQTARRICTNAITWLT